MRFLIMGTGALGTVFGGFLAKAGHDVLLVGRNLAHMNAIRADGIRITGIWGEHIATSAQVIESPAERDVQLRTGSDDGIIAWLDGKQVLRVARPRGLVRDEDRTPIHLKRGANRLLLKITQGGGSWSFCVRLADPKGDLAGLAWHTPN